MATLSDQTSQTSQSSLPMEEDKAKAQAKSHRSWAFGILQDPFTEEVPGSVLLLSKAHKNNAPLGMSNVPRRASSPSLPTSPYPQSEAMFRPPSHIDTEKKRTKDGTIILEPQPEDTANDPLNWSPLRRDLALISLGIYCMLGGGMTPVLAAGYNDVAADYNIPVPKVALTTGLYMLGLGVGSVIFSPTAILLGKRPIYLATSVMFLLTAVWCALSPSYGSLIVARIFQGIAVSPVECLPSATIAEIFFLHERAYRLGVYTLLLLGGKNLVPLVSAAIIQRLGWRWVFWIVAMVVAFCGVLLFFFVPETFWDRSPVPHKSSSKRRSHASARRTAPQQTHIAELDDSDLFRNRSISGSLAQRREHRRTRFASQDENIPVEKQESEQDTSQQEEEHQQQQKLEQQQTQQPSLHASGLVDLERLAMSEKDNSTIPAIQQSEKQSRPVMLRGQSTGTVASAVLATPSSEITFRSKTSLRAYTDYYRSAPVKSYLQTLKPWDGRLTHENWFRIAARPFVLFAYPAILWSAAVYMLSVGWLIVLSESVSQIYESRDTYNFTSLQAGLVYISPFVGGVLGTAVAGKLSDLIVRAMSKRNGGIYEPEFRLVMAIPVALCTTIGLMGFGWSAQERDAWIVPTIFFGVISFGCCVGSTTAITFAVDSYRQYAGEALVTLNWSKNVFHGLVFSLFFNRWLESDGSRSVFLAIGGIQLGVMLFTIPMYIFGKRARMWTVRQRMMERF